MRGKYQATLALQNMIQLMNMSSFMTASQMRLAMLPFQPWFDFYLGYFDRNPTTLKLQGVRSLFALHPVFKRIASRMPDSIGIQFGEGTSAPKKRGYDDVTMAFSISRPYRNIEAAAVASNLQTAKHQKADFAHLIKNANISLAHEGHEEDLLCFKPTKGKSKGVKYLVAPRSGHFSTLVAPVIQFFVNQGYTIYVNDLKDAAYTPNTGEEHGMDEQARDKIEAMEKIYALEGKKPDVIAICQGMIPTFIAIAKICKDKLPFKPKSYTFLSGPGDTDVTKSTVNEVGEDMSNYFLDNIALSTVPSHLPGAGKEVRAGHSQVADFVSGNPGRHMHDLTTIMNFIVQNGREWVHHTPLTQKQILDLLEKDNLDELETAFLNEILFRTEYNTSADHPGPSFRQAIHKNFQQNFIANDQTTYFGEPVSIKDIDIPVLAGDAEKDDVSSIGQTVGVLAHMTKNIVKSAIVILGKGHFWWAGKTAANNQWKQILAWQENPEAEKPGADIETYKPEMIDTAKVVHAQNLAKEEEKINNSLPVGWKVIHGGREYDLTPEVDLSPQRPKERTLEAA